jgi:hypothetical protein
VEEEKIDSAQQCGIESNIIMFGIQIRRIRMFLGLPDPEPLVIWIRIRILPFSHKCQRRQNAMPMPDGTWLKHFLPEVNVDWDPESQGSRSETLKRVPLVASAACYVKKKYSASYCTNKQQ